MRYGMLAALFTTALVASTAGRAAAQQAIPDLRGTWKGQSESVIFGGGNPHHAPTTGPAAPIQKTITPVRNSPIPKVAVKKEITHQMISDRAYFIGISGQGGSELPASRQAQRNTRFSTATSCSDPSGCGS